MFNFDGLWNSSRSGLSEPKRDSFRVIIPSLPLWCPVKIRSTLKQQDPFCLIYPI
jgi:hypothetical protein